MLTIGVTGGSGFIGSALIERHRGAGDVVRCLTRRRDRLPQGVEAVEGDLAAPDESLTRFCEGLDILYHCAAEINDERRMPRVNVDGVSALLRAAAGRIGRWVQLSSIGVYGRHLTGVISEATPLAPRTLYEQTKTEADTLVLEAARTHQVPSCSILRPSIVFGAGMPNQSLVQMVGMIRRGLFFFIGRSGASANYVHVSNVADALLLCGTSPAAAGRVYNLSDWCTVEEFAGAIADSLGRPRPRFRVPERLVRCAIRMAGRFANLPLTESRVDALVSRSRYSTERIERDLGYAHAVSIPEGLAGLVASRRLA